jgi:hypothetical protein
VRVHGRSAEAALAHTHVRWRAAGCARSGSGGGSEGALPPEELARVGEVVGADVAVDVVEEGEEHAHRGHDGHDAELAEDPLPQGTPFSRDPPSTFGMRAEQWHAGRACKVGRKETSQSRAIIQGVCTPFCTKHKIALVHAFFCAC